MNNQEEVWKAINGLTNCYFVSNLGRVKSVGKTMVLRDKSISIRPDCYLKNSITNWGYCRVVLQDHGIRKHFRVHRLVAEAFIPNPQNKPHVNHIDGNKQNNKSDNLEWVTNKENQEHALKTGLKRIINNRFVTIKTT